MLYFRVNLEEFRSNHNVSTNATMLENEMFNFSRESCIYIYSSLILLMISVTLIRSFVFFKACMRASITLHDNMFTSITRATMYFFNTNNSGRILNRFSKDVGNIDEQLPSALIDVLQVVE